MNAKVVRILISSVFSFAPLHSNALSLFQYSPKLGETSYYYFYTHDKPLIDPKPTPYVVTDCKKEVIDQGSIDDIAQKVERSKINAGNQYFFDLKRNHVIEVISAEPRESPTQFQGGCKVTAYAKSLKDCEGLRNRAKVIADECQRKWKSRGGSK